MENNSATPSSSVPNQSGPTTPPSMGSTPPHIDSANPVHSDPPSSAHKSSMAPMIFAVVLAIFTGVLGFYIGRMTAPIPQPTAQETPQNTQPSVFDATEAPTATEAITVSPTEPQSSGSAQNQAVPQTQQ
jgi:hypothetical protein